MAGSYEQSKTHYQTYLQHYKGKNFLKDVHYKLFVLYYISDQDQTAFNFWNKIPQTGNSIYESDKYAEQQYKYKSIPNKQLAKVRFFTDGGYYPQAFEILNKLYIDQLKSQKDKIEFYYRYARLYHKTANLSEAIDYYEKVIHINTTQTFYFAPNACLQLGYIYTYLKQNDKAKYYFNKAIEYKNHEYENSIEQKAKVALRALN
jgi:tetratricopeptide (TPR) repeat protein